MHVDRLDAIFSSNNHLLGMYLGKIFYLVLGGETDLMIIKFH